MYDTSNRGELSIPLQAKNYVLKGSPHVQHVTMISAWFRSLNSNYYTKLRVIECAIIPPSTIAKLHSTIKSKSTYTLQSHCNRLTTSFLQQIVPAPSSCSIIRHRMAFLEVTIHPSPHHCVWKRRCCSKNFSQTSSAD